MAVPAEVNFAFASEWRHFAKRAHRFQHFGPGLSASTLDVAGACRGRRRSPRVRLARLDRRTKGHDGYVVLTGRIVRRGRNGILRRRRCRTIRVVRPGRYTRRRIRIAVPWIPSSRRIGGIGRGVVVRIVRGVIVIVRRCRPIAVGIIIGIIAVSVGVRPSPAPA